MQVSPLEEKTKRYWMAAAVWRHGWDHPTIDNVGDLIDELAELRMGTTRVANLAERLQMLVVTEEQPINYPTAVA